MSTPKKQATRTRKPPAQRTPKIETKAKALKKRPISAAKRLHGQYMGLLNGVGRDTQRKARALAKADKKAAAVALLKKAHAG